MQSLIFHMKFSAKLYKMLQNGDHHPHEQQLADTPILQLSRETANHLEKHWTAANFLQPSYFS